MWLCIYFLYTRKERDMVRGSWGLSSILSVRKVVITYSFSMIYWSIEGLTKVGKKAKIAESGGCGACFCELCAFRGSCKEGVVNPIWRGQNWNMWSLLRIAMVSWVIRGFWVIFCESGSENQNLWSWFWIKVCCDAKSRLNNFYCHHFWRFRLAAFYWLWWIFEIKIFDFAEIAFYKTLYF